MIKIKETEYIIPYEKLDFTEKNNFYEGVLSNLNKKYSEKIINTEIKKLTEFEIYHNSINKTDLSIQFKIITDLSKKSEINISDYYRLNEYIKNMLEFKRVIPIRRIKREIIR